MIKSMTAYGRCSQETALGFFVVEVHSVNRKILDVSISLPKELLRFEIEVRKWIVTQVERGQVTVRISFQPQKRTGQRSIQTLENLREAQQFWLPIVEQLGLDSTKEVGLNFLIDQVAGVEPTASDEDDQLIRAGLKEVVDGALMIFVEMKKVEGGVLVQDIQNRLSQIDQFLASIERRREEPLKRYQKKIMDRLQEITPLTVDLQERVAKEVVILAEKSDITEEIVRANSHIQQFQSHLKCAEQAVGRTLDFLIQEMHREVNTLSSKSLDIEISSFVVKIKSELEKIREQVQNIE